MVTSDDLKKKYVSMLIKELTIATRTCDAARREEVIAAVAAIRALPPYSAQTAAAWIDACAQAGRIVVPDADVFVEWPRMSEGL